MARLAADQDAAHRPGIADPGGEIAARPLCRGQVGKVRTVAFARVDDHDAGRAACAQDAAGRGDGGAQQGDIVAKGGAEAARLKKVALHVDDDQRGGGGIEGERIRFSVDLRHACFLGRERVEGADFVVGCRDDAGAAVDAHRPEGKNRGQQKLLAQPAVTCRHYLGKCLLLCMIAGGHLQFCLIMLMLHAAMQQRGATTPREPTRATKRRGKGTGG